ERGHSQYLPHNLFNPLQVFFFTSRSFFIFIRRRHPPSSTLFPYTTLFRSQRLGVSVGWLYRPRDVEFKCGDDVCLPPRRDDEDADRKSTRLNSSHVKNSYAVFCLKKKTTFQTNLTNKEKIYVTRFME